MKALKKSEKLKIKIVDSEVGSSPVVEISDVNEASKRYRAFIEEHGFGSSQSGVCLIYKGNEVIGHVSYNGKVWSGTPQQWKSDSEPIFDPHREEMKRRRGNSLKIDIYESSISKVILVSFKTKEEFEEYCQAHPTLFPENVAINGLCMLGWDEIEMMLKGGF